VGGIEEQQGFFKWRLDLLYGNGRRMGTEVGFLSVKTLASSSSTEANQGKVRSG
jgi:hypothetical protein